MPSAPSSEALLAAKGLKRAKNDRSWDWLREVSTNIRNYMRSPAIILPMLNDDRLKASLATAGRSADMVALVQRLNQDIVTFAERFRAIHTQHSARRGSSSNVDDMILCISLSQEYLQFMSSYESVVMPTVQEILELMETAGLDVSTVRAAAGAGLVYELYQQDDAK